MLRFGFCNSGQETQHRRSCVRSRSTEASRPQRSRGTVGIVSSRWLNGQWRSCPLVTLTTGGLLEIMPRLIPANLHLLVGNERDILHPFRGHPVTQVIAVARKTRIVSQGPFFLTHKFSPLGPRFRASCYISRISFIEVICVQTISTFISISLVIWKCVGLPRFFFPVASRKHSGIRAE